MWDREITPPPSWFDVFPFPVLVFTGASMVDAIGENCHVLAYCILGGADEKKKETIHLNTPYDICENIFKMYVPVKTADMGLLCSNRNLETTEGRVDSNS